MLSESRIYLNENSPIEDPLNSDKKSTNLMNRLERDVHSSQKNIEDYDFSEDWVFGIGNLFLLTKLVFSKEYLYCSSVSLLDYLITS